MPRKYAGPLQPGKRSAYVPGTRRNRTRASAARSIQSAWRRYKSQPSRLRVSASRYRLNKAIARQINTMSENKFQGFNVICANPESKPAGVQPISYHFFNTGTTLTSAANSMFNPMNLFSFPKGDDNNQRNGDYMYLKKVHLKMELQMLPFSSTVPLDAESSTTEFRLMIVKANRKYNKLGESPVAGNSLFLDTENGQFGFGVPGGVSTTSTFANMRQPINKRKWLVYKDMRFTLSTPSQSFGDTSVPSEYSITNTANNKYPVKKYITCDLPIYKKTHFDSSSDIPDSVDTQWLLIIQAVRSNYCSVGTSSPRNYNLNILGTTSASDN